MLEIPASEIAKNFGRYRELAQREPVAVTSHNRVSAVLISQSEYAEYERLKRLATRALSVGDLSPESLAAIAAAQMDPRHAALDALMDED